MRAKMLAGLYAGRLCRAGALLIMCATLTSCFYITSNSRWQLSSTYSRWQHAGAPPVIRCRYPLDIIIPTYFEKMEPQAYTSMRDFSEAAVAAQAPILECGVIGGRVAEPDAAPDAAQIAGMNWGRLGYALLHTWHPGSGYANYYRGGGEVCEEDITIPRTSMFGDFEYPPTYTCYYRKATYSYKKISAAYGAWYLAYQRIPQDNVQNRRQGVGLYAMQGFRCAVHMRDFPAARRYWELAINGNPESTAQYARLALQSILQGAGSIFEDGSRGSDYLDVPQDMRRAVWDAAGQSYSGIEGKIFSMTEVENAAQAGTLRKLLFGVRGAAGYTDHVPLQSVMYCPVFYPDFDPIPFIHPFDRNFSVPTSDLITAVERADKEAREAREATK